MRFLRTSLLFVILFNLTAGILHAQETEPLRVATKLFPPLVLKQSDLFTGFSIQLWEAIASNAGLDYELYEVETVVDQLDAIQNGDADVAIAGITITAEREQVLDFSFPYFDAGLQIMVREDEITPISHALAAVLSPDFLQFLLMFVGLILVAAHILWFIERRRNPKISASYLPGISQMLWWSAVTVIGYDDVPPSTIGGRVMALIWMFAGIFLIANLTASLSAGATVRELQSSISDISDLRNNRVATVNGTTSAQYLATAGIRYTGTETIDEAYELLRDRNVEAVVYDAPVLLYYVITHEDDIFRTVGQPFGMEEYGIALPEGSPHRETINRAILSLLEDGTYQQIYNRWFGQAAS
ncbi:MAG: amino acid ABC transporter substrate-binding protein [Anaerolineaceae bacterium]|nr:amino acid ABC transporter substrate-binding protein [Anaerolineaceae bacterium]